MGEGILDSDGDGCTLLDIKGINGFEMTTEKALAVNNSVAGPGGYKAVWKTVPYFEFMSHEDKLGKKAIVGNSTPFATTTLGKLGAIDADMLGEFAIKVSAHYKQVVGSTYAIASELTFRTLSEVKS